jgi:hypothetical protein
MTKKERFRRAYKRLAREGKCDGYGGMESRRVWRAWQTLGYPEPLEHFIVTEANAGPTRKTDGFSAN